MYDLRMTLNERASNALRQYAGLHGLDVYTALSDLVMARLEHAGCLPFRLRFADCEENIRVRRIPRSAPPATVHSAPGTSPGRGKQKYGRDCDTCLFYRQPLPCPPAGDSTKNNLDTRSVET